MNRNTKKNYSAYKNSFNTAFRVITYRESKQARACFDLDSGGERTSRSRKVSAREHNSRLKQRPRKSYP